MKEQGGYHSSSCITSTTSTTNSICCDDETAPSIVHNVASASNPSLQNIGEQHQSLHDIFQYLSEVPLHPTVIAPPSHPGLDYHRCDAPTSNESFFFEEGYGPVQIVDQDYHNKGPEMKDTTDLSKEHSKGKQLLEPQEPHKPHTENQRDLLKKRSQKRSNENRRRHLINAKLRTMKALLPNRDKRDHVSILDHAIEYIKSMKLQIDMMSAVHTYAPQMIMQPRIGIGPWGSQATPPGYPLIGPPFGFGGGAFPFQPSPHALVCQVPFMPSLRPQQFLPTPIGTPLTPGVLLMSLPQRQFTPPRSSDQAPRFQPPNTR